MSKSSDATVPREGEQVSEVPRAVIHKKILDAARSRPDDSMEEIAADVSGANVNLVEQVLDEYGDPGSPSEVTGDGTAAETETDPNSDHDSAMSTSESKHDDSPPVDPADLTEKQLATLRIIRDNPDATQEEIAEEFGVTSATISHRVNGVEGFDWADRHEFAKSMVEKTNGDTHSTMTDTDDQGSSSVESREEISDRISALGQRLDAIEQRVEDEPTSPPPVLSDPALIHKVIRACMNSESISDEEELRIIEGLVAG